MQQGRQLRSDSVAMENAKKSDAISDDQRTVTGTSSPAGHRADVNSKSTVATMPETIAPVALAAVTIDQEPPNDVNPKLWALLLRINDNVEKSSISIDDISSRLTAVERGYDEMTEKVLSLESENKKQQSHISLLNARISILEKRLIQQCNVNTDLTVRSMNQNIVFTCKNDAIPESEGEYCLAIVKDIIATKLRIPHGIVGVVRAHRLGRPSGGRCRPIVARLQSREHVAEVLKRGKNLNGTDIYVNQQYPPEVAERRQFCHTPYKAARGQEGVVAKMATDRLYINNELQRHLLPPVLPDTQLEDDTEPPTLSSSSIKTNSKCSVQTYAATTVSSMEDMRRAYDTAITMCRRTPDSIVYAFRFDDNRGLKQNFESVGEGGIGYRLLRMMQSQGLNNTMVIVALWYENNTRKKGSGFYKMIEDSLGETMK